MSIRKEQVLLLVALAFGAWMYSGIEGANRVKKRRLALTDYHPQPSRAPLTAAAVVSENLRDLFIEPSESRPLPPRELPFPELDSLAVLPLPLVLDPPPLAVLGSVTFQAGDRFDTIHFANLSYPGFFLGPENQKLAMAKGSPPFAGGFRFQWIDKETGKTQDVLPVAGKDIVRLVVAQTLRNHVLGKARDITPGASNTEAQREFILELLRYARLQPWIYELALDRAEKYLGIVKPKEQGYLYKAIVLRAMGDLGREYELFKGLDKVPGLAGSSFQRRGLGLIQARLGLDAYAEKNLRRAVDINTPIDSRNYAALADFLLDAGRAEEAVPYARQAVAFKGRADPTEAERLGYHGLLVRALLAVDDPDGADVARATSTADEKLGFLVKFQEAHVAYAKREYDRALGLFQECANSGILPDAQLGLGACQLAKGDADAAKASFARVADQTPRLRHLALTGLGLVASAAKDGAGALGHLDSAITANPEHPYIRYALGRQRRLNGDIEGAVRPLQDALAMRDDFIEAIAELTVTNFELYKRNRDDSKLVAALRYADRLVALDYRRAKRRADRVPGNGQHVDRNVLFLQHQGKIYYEARLLPGARKAFELGENKSSFCVLGLAILDYAQKRFDEAIARLERMRRNLPKDHKHYIHAVQLMAWMHIHGSKEVVIDRFDRPRLGRNWVKEAGRGVSVGVVQGELGIRGKLSKSGQAVAIRKLNGAGRFLELTVEMKVAATNLSKFAGIVVEMPSRNGTSRFGMRLGMDEDGELVFELRDGRETHEPVRTKIRVSPGEWHRLRLSVVPDDAAALDSKNTARTLRVFFDGERIVEPIKLKGLKRNSNTNSLFHTELRVESVAGQGVEVVFDNYVRVQEKE